jgi:hypothetical protein
MGELARSSCRVKGTLRAPRAPFWPWSHASRASTSPRTCRPKRARSLPPTDSPKPEATNRLGRLPRAGELTVTSPRPVTDQDRQRIRQLHAEGLGRNDIARELGRSGQTISKIADELGLRFDRAATLAATRARKADAAALRATLTLDYLRDAQRLRHQLWEPHKAYNFGGKDNTYNEQQFDEPPVDAKLKLMQASTMAADRSVRLEQHDAGDGGLAGGLVADLVAGLRGEQGAEP